MNTKKIEITLLTSACIFALGACSKKEQTFIDLNKNEVTLDASGKSVVTMKTNQGAKYTLLDQDHHDKKLFSPKTAKKGNVRLTISEAGKYKVKVTNDDESETKEIIVKSPKVSAGDNTQFSDKSLPGKGQQINKTTNVVGSFQYKILTINSEKVTNKEKNYTDAEYNLEDRDALNQTYYRTTIKYELKNVGTQPIDLSYGSGSSVIGDNGTDYSNSGNVGSYSFDTLLGEGKLQPNTIKNGKFILISNDQIELKNPKINVGEQLVNEDTVVSEGGVATLQDSKPE